MIYLEELYLPGEESENFFIANQHSSCYNTYYPFSIFPEKNLKKLEFEPITILYGGNGSGKTTLLNIIAEKTDLIRHSAFSGSAFFKDFCEMCTVVSEKIPRHNTILTSDDITDYLLNMRHLNNGINLKREELFQEYTERRYRENRFTGLADYDKWKDGFDAKTKNPSSFVSNRLMKNTDMNSNGETALNYYVQRIEENALYLIDEPENSLSAPKQLELAEFIQQSARFFGCQFIISTHSPFFLALKDSEIYNLDLYPVSVQKWTELENVRVYYDFFDKHRKEFETSSP